MLVISCLLTLAPLAANASADERNLSVEVRAAEERGEEILLSMQESLAKKKRKKATPGEWPYEGVYRVGGEIPIGYRVGGTSIAAWSLLELPGWEEAEDRHDAVERALDFVLEGLEEPLMESGFKGGYDVRGWGHAYALTFMLRLRELDRVPKKRRVKVDRAIKDLVKALNETEIPESGGWNYARRAGGDAPAPTSTFMTASTLQALFAAGRQGEKVDDEVIGRALDALERSRLDNNAFPYTAVSGNRGGRGKVPGAIARMAICETTLHLAGRGNPAALRGSIEAFFEHWDELEKRRKKTGTHEGPYGVAPYYFFYGHMYLAQAIELLPESERAPWHEKLQETLLSIREESGGWNDRVFPRSENFGTAMTLLAFAWPRLGAPPPWPAD